MAKTRPGDRCLPGFVIAIDGPAGSGKSTTARLVARALRFRHLDTGAMYRAVTLRLLRSGAQAEEGPGLRRLLRDCRVEPRWRGNEMRVYLDGEDVGRAIRDPAISSHVSRVSALPSVRRKLVAAQRCAAAGENVVCEGRDIGSVVFPEADVKVYLVCDTAERARRRQLELLGSGRRVRAQAVRANLEERDRIDSGREMSPLTRVPDAVLVDTTHLTIDEQVAVVCALAWRRREMTRT